MTQDAALPAPSKPGRVRAIAAGCLLLVALLLAGSQTIRLARAVHHLSRAHGGGVLLPQRPDELPTWMPLRSIAHHYRMPASVLVDALRAAGFTVDVQEVPRDRPDARQRVRPGRPAEARPLAPEQQSLRQIAAISGRPETDAAAVVLAAMQQYRADHPLPPGRPSPLRLPPTPRGP